MMPRPELAHGAMPQGLVQLGEQSPRRDAERQRQASQPRHRHLVDPPEQVRPIDGADPSGDPGDDRSREHAARHRDRKDQQVHIRDAEIHDWARLP